MKIHSGRVSHFEHVYFKVTYGKADNAMLSVAPAHLPNVLLAESLIWIWMIAWDREESALTPVAPVLRSLLPFKIT